MANREALAFPMRRAGRLGRCDHVVALLALVSLLTLVPALHPQPAQDRPAAREMLRAFGDLPLAFVANGDQTDPVVRFQASSLGRTLFFTAGEVLLSLASSTHDAIMHTPGIRAAPAAEALGVRFEGASAATQLRGEQQLPGVVSYFRGKPEQWRSNLPSYGELVYQGLYPGIDLHYQGTGQRLKGTYTLAPGADPRQIRWRYVGAEHIGIDQSSGAIRIALARPSDCPPTSCAPPALTEEAPIAWQVIGARRVPVAVRYVLLDSAEIAGQAALGFALGHYDAAYPLTIDPTLAYSTFLGGSDFDEGTGIAADGTGNVYVVGSTSSTDFPTQQALYPANRDIRDVFVAKFNPSGNALLFSTYLGGTNLDLANDIALDSAGNIYITGMASIGIGLTSDFPTTPGAYDRTIEATSAFVTKIDASGSKLDYSTFLGGPGINEGLAIAVDSSGSAYVFGDTSSTSFPTKNALQPSYGGGTRDAFVAKFNPSGSDLVYSTFLGGSDTETTLDTYGAGIAVDAQGQLYVASVTRSSNFPTTAGAFHRIYNGPADGFISKFSAAGNTLVYSTFLGGSGSLEAIYDLALNGAGEAYVTGTTNSTDFPTKNPLQTLHGLAADIFITRLNAAGSDLVYSTYLGGSIGDMASSIALDSAGNIYVTGSTSSIDLPTKDPIQAKPGAGSPDAFVLELNASGNALLFGSYLGGSSRDWGYAIAVDQAGSIYLTGDARSADFPLKNALQSTFQNAAAVGDAFVSKIVASSQQVPGFHTIFLPLAGRREAGPFFCDAYERNDNRRVNPSGPLASGQPIQAKLCTGDAEDNFYFDATTSGNAQIILALPAPLLGSTSLWLYAQDNLESTTPCGTGTVAEPQHIKECPIAKPGRYIVRLYTDGVNDDVNSYSLRVVYP